MKSNINLSIVSLSMSKLFMAAFISVLIIVMVTACAEDGTGSGIIGEKIRAVATTTQIADMLKNVGGERVEVTTPVKGDGRFNDYIPTKPDLKAVETAQVIYKNGAGLDDWLAGIYQSTGSKALIVDLSEGIRLLDYKFQKQPAFQPNPYYWLRAANGKIMVEHIAGVLESLDNSNSQHYRTNSRNYQWQLDQVVEKVKALLMTIPVNQRKLLTDSEAMTYFADEFGLEFLEPLTAGQNCNNEAISNEPLPDEKLARLQETSAVFFDRLCNPAIIKKIGKEAGVKIILNLYTESLTLPGREVDTYLRMLLNNALVISLGLR